MNSFKPGDVLGFSGKGWLSAFINLFTYGIPYYHISHVGIVAEVIDVDVPGVYPKLQDGMFLFESTISGAAKCLLTGAETSGVKAHDIQETIKSSGGRVWLYPLREPLRPMHSRMLTSFLVRQLNKDYDYIGAFRAAGYGFSFIESVLRKEDLSSVYCSELFAAAYRHLKLLDTRNVSMWSPNRLLRKLRKSKVLNEPIRLK